MDVANLEGCFVVEVGVRQAWPFIVFCDNSQALSAETRLYIDAKWSVNETTGSPESDHGKWLTSAVKLNNCTITNVLLDADHNLRIDTDYGDSLTVSGEPTPTTGGEPWWFAPASSV